MNYTQSITVACIDGSDKTTTLSDLVSHQIYTILYFYPKDCTSGCTMEAMEFSQMVDEFSKLWAQVVWVSKDSLTSHHKFISQSQLKVDLISDGDTSLHQAFGTWWEKSMYGRKYMWTVRSTFVLDKSARIITQYTNVIARGHAQQVLQDLQSHINAL
jgi:peroxiredoxin Q/BCP